LVRAQEFVADQLLSIHNLFFYRELMRSMRVAILEGSFKDFYTQRKPFLEARDAENPSVPPKRKKERDETALGDYQVVEHGSGNFGSVKQVSSGETMHSVSDPLVEAEALYVEQSQLRERVRASEDSLVVWDVGLGAATNAMACIKALEGLRSEGRTEGNRRQVQIVSFERDLDSLRLALRHPRLFRHLRHPAPHALLESGLWRSKVGQSDNGAPEIEWRLLQGDFAELFERAPVPEVVLYDPFSAKVDTALWEFPIFERLFKFCNDSRPRGTALYTYTNSTSIRGALLSAGWFVGRGRATGPKTETTVACSPRACESPFAPPLLGMEWLDRWDRSGARQPAGTVGEEFLLRIRNHPQFAQAVVSHAIPRESP
jgi:queuine tRNA-ribosyltransferase